MNKNILRALLVLVVLLISVIPTRAHAYTYDDAMAKCQAARANIIASGPGWDAYCDPSIYNNAVAIPVKNPYSNGQYSVYGYWSVDINSASPPPGVPGKNAGSCNCKSNPINLVAADPINLGTGNEYRDDEDAALGDLSIHRYYNSETVIASAHSGPNWRQSFDRSLNYTDGSATAVITYRPDGHQFVFTQSGTNWTTDPDVSDRLTSSTDTSGNVTGWTYFEAATRQTESYSASGQLNAITDADQQVTALTYSTASTPTSVAPVAGLLITVTDARGRQLSFVYDSNSRISTITLPDGGVLGYQYDSTTGNLIKVTYPDTSFKQYVYNESTLTTSSAYPNALTGEIDETQTRFGDIGYGTQGRAVLSRQAGGADLTQVAYNSDGTSTVTYPNGVQTTLGFVVPNGSVHANALSAPCGSGCGQPNQSATFDSNGYPASYTDFNGNLTTTTYDTNGLLDQQVDASGTANQRTTTTTWNTTLRVPLTRTVQDNNSNLVASTAWAHNARGQTTAQCEIDPATSGASSYTCGSAANAPAGVRQWRTIYCDAVDTTQCPLVGLPLTVDGPRTDVSDVTTYTYYLTDSATAKHGDLKSFTDALGHASTILSYDGAGRVLTAQDANGVTTTYTYYPRGWLHTRSVGGATTTITYTAYGAVQKITDPDGIAVTCGYDAAHRLTTITDAQGNYVQYTLDAAGSRTAEKTYASGSTTASRTLTRTFNTLGQLTKVIDGLNHTVFNASTSGNYDGNGNLVQSVDALNVARKQGYDALNRLTQTLDNYNGTDVATKNTTSGFAYDALDRLTGVTDPSSLTTTYGYDGLGNRITLQSPDTGSSSDTYDVAGNRLTHTDAKGIVSTTAYDALNRPTSTSYADPTLNVTYAYDEANSVTGCSASYSIGRPTRVIESAVTTVYCYDIRGNTTRKQQITSANTDTTSYSYTSADRLNTLTEPSGSLIAYGHDSVGRVNSVTVTPTGGSTSTAVSNVSYLPFGPVASYTLGNGQNVTRTYDANYALSDLTSPAMSLHFARDAMGNITAEGSVPGANPATESYGYDPLYRLKTVTDGSTPLQSFTYNPAGDRLSKTGSGLATGTYGYQSNTHWLTTIGSAARTYDANGNTTAASQAGLAFGYGYNGRNRLAVAQASGNTVGTYTYNAMDQRIQKVATCPMITERFIYGDASQLLGEYGTTTRDYVWLGDILVAALDTTGTTSTVNFVTTDHLGTPRAVSNSAGTMIWSWPYIGNVFEEQQPTSVSGYVLNLRSAGEYYDAETGLNSNGYRARDPNAWRFLQSDPTGLQGGMSTYAAVGNNPLSFTDPLGLLALPSPAPAPAPIPTPGPTTGPVPDHGPPANDPFIDPEPEPWFNPVALCTENFAACIIAGALYSSDLSDPQTGPRNLPTNQICPKDKPCPPCRLANGTIVPLGTIGYKLDKVPPSRPHWPYTGDHYNLSKANQIPHNCNCFWQPLGAANAAGGLPPPLGSIPIEPFVN